ETFWPKAACGPRIMRASRGPCRSEPLRQTFPRTTCKEIQRWGERYTKGTRVCGRANPRRMRERASCKATPEKVSRRGTGAERACKLLRPQTQARQPKKLLNFGISSPAI